jgi:hypothetical protein
MSRARPNRRFTLIDAMIFIAASAPGFLHLKHCIDDPILGANSQIGANSQKLGVNLMILYHYINFIIPFMLMMTIAVLIIRLRKPRPPCRRIFRQPGTMACFGAIAVVLLEAVGSLIAYGMLAFDSSDGSFWAVAQEITDWAWMGERYWEIPPRIGHVVGILWLVSILSRRWYPEPSWIDRLGRILGGFWIALIPFSWFSNLYG